METRKKAKEKPRFAEIYWTAGIIICALGVRLASNSGFGVSMVAAPALVFFRFLAKFIPGITYGIAEYTFHAILLVLLAVILRRFKWKYPVAFLTGFLFGLALDGWGLVFGVEVYSSLASRIIAAAAGALVTAIAIAGFLRSYLPQQVYELIVTEVTDKYKLNIGKVKWCYDVASLILSVVMMLLLLRTFDTSVVGIGTLIITVVNAPLIAMFGKILDRFFDPDSAFPGFKKWFEKIFD